MNWAELMLEKSGQSGGSAISRGGETVLLVGWKREMPLLIDIGVLMAGLARELPTNLAIAHLSW